MKRLWNWRDYTTKKKCRFCSKIFRAYIPNVKRGFGKYCSKPCSNKANDFGFKKGHKSYLTKESKIKIGNYWRGRKRKIVSKETRLKMREAQIKRWDKVGRKKCNSRRRKCVKCIEWRKKVFERDNYICQICGKRNVYIEADHIKSWKNFPKLRHIITNGRTLCKICHMETPNYKSKARIWKG